MLFYPFWFWLVQVRINDLVANAHFNGLMPALLFLVITSNWISHIFLSGYGKAGIVPKAFGIKGQKAVAFQLRSPPAAEAKAINLKELTSQGKDLAN